MTAALFVQAICKFISGAIFTALMLFLPAGTIHWANGWLFMALLFIPLFLVGIFLMVKDPELLEKRLNGHEKEDEQKKVLLLSGIMFTVGFVLCGLGKRFAWYTLPTPAVAVSCVIFIIAFILYGEVMRENRWLSRTVEVQDGQKVVSTGMYGIVRHPMYSVTIVLFLAMPLILGSIYAFILFLSYPFFISRRIRNEEEVLLNELPGYEEYTKKVKYRLIPFIW